jgi:hypothetical protein
MLYKDLETHHHRHNIRCYIQVSQEERSVFWEVTVSVILRETVYMHMCPSRTVFETELFPCRVPKLLIRR